MSKTKIKIDKGIPLPRVLERKNSRVTSGKYPFAQMEVGDSFAIPLNPRETSKTGEPASTYRVSSAVNQRKRKHGGEKYAVRRLYSKNEVRVWRVA